MCLPFYYSFENDDDACSHEYSDDKGNDFNSYYVLLSMRFLYNEKDMTIMCVCM